MNHGGNVWEKGSPSGWMDFSVNLRPDGPPFWISEAIHSAQRYTGFYPDPEMKRAGKGIAAFLGIPEERVLPVPGGIAAIDLALSLSPGCVYTQPPTFSEYARRATIHGRPGAVWTGNCREGDTLVICNPNNPTGSIQTRQELLGTLDGLAENGGELLIDEAFIEYCAEYSMRGCIRPGLIIAGSLSKILGTPGIRLGYLCAEPETIRTLRQMILPWQLDAFATEVAVRIPEHTDDIRADAVRNTERRKDFAGMLQELGAEVYPSGGNFLLVDFHRDMSPAAEQLKARSILVRTCASFGLPDSFLRLAVKREKENERLVNELEEILHVR